MWQDRCIERRCSTTGSTWLSNRPQGGASHTQRHVNSADGGGSESNHVSDIGAALLGKMIGEHTTQQYTEVKTIISKDSQVAPKRMQLAVRLAVNTHNMGERSFCRIGEECTVFDEPAKGGGWTRNHS